MGVMFRPWQRLEGNVQGQRVLLAPAKSSSSAQNADIAEVCHIDPLAAQYSLCSVLNTHTHACDDPFKAATTRVTTSSL